MEPNASPDPINPLTSDVNFGFSDIFNLEDIRNLQELFSDNTTGVVSLITYPDGTPITSPGNLCRSWDACASITVGGKHVANWLIGQVPGEGVPVLSVEQLNKVTKLLYALAGQLSEKGTSNLQLKMQINERRRAEEELLSSQQITEDIINLIPVSVFWKDSNLRYLGCNSKFASDAGFSRPEEVIGKDDFMVGWRDQAELYRNDDRQVIRSGSPKLLIQEHQTTPEGKTITILTNKIPLRNSKEEVIGILGTYMDITDRKRAEDLLAQTRRNYETFFNTIDDFLFVLDEQGNIIHTNTSVTNRLGYTIEELYGKSVLLVHPPERRDEAGRILSEMLNGVSEYCLVPFVTKSGIQIPVETRAFHGYWDGNPAIFGVTKDISKIKLSEEKFSKLFYINPSACGLTDLVSGKYTEVNEAFYTLFGFDKNEVIGKTPLELGLLTNETLNALTQTITSKGITAGVEADLIAKNGDVKHVLLSSENIFIQENKLLYTVVQDITGSKQKEAEIKRNNEELIKINSEKDKFFSIIAHDLRSPFHTLLGFTRLMVEELPTLTLDEIQKIAVSMRNSANKLFNLLENLLEWSQMQRGLRSFKPESLLLVEELLPIVELIRDASDKKMITISSDLPEDLRIIADPHMFESMMRNLVFNAVKFTPKGGKIAIAAKPMPDNFVEISIKDTGIGMSKKMIDNLFRLDEQSTRLGTEGEPSTGLGLISVSKKTTYF